MYVQGRQDPSTRLSLNGFSAMLRRCAVNLVAPERWPRCIIESESILIFMPRGCTTSSSTPILIRQQPFMFAECMAIVSEKSVRKFCGSRADNTRSLENQEGRSAALLSPVTNDCFCRCYFFGSIMHKITSHHELA